MKSKIHLIRHGTTEGNVKKWYYGSLDIPLIEAGRTALIEMRENGIYPKINGGYFTSGMKRTNQTLSIIYGNVERDEITQLREMEFGDFEGKTYEEIKDNSDYIKWLEDKVGSVALPRGDSRISFRNRVMTGLEKLINNHLRFELVFRHKEDIDAESICVCHGGVIGCIMNELFPKEREFFYWIPNQGRGFTLLLDGGKVVGYCEL